MPSTIQVPSRSRAPRNRPHRMHRHRERAAITSVAAIQLASVSDHLGQASNPSHPPIANVIQDIRANNIQANAHLRPSSATPMKFIAR